MGLEHCSPSTVMAPACPLAVPHDGQGWRRGFRAEWSRHLWRHEEAGTGGQPLPAGLVPAITTVHAGHVSPPASQEHEATASPAAERPNGRCSVLASPAGWRRRRGPGVTCLPGTVRPTVRPFGPSGAGGQAEKCRFEDEDGRACPVQAVSLGDPTLSAAHRRRAGRERFWGSPGCSRARVSRTGHGLTSLRLDRTGFRPSEQENASTVGHV